MAVTITFICQLENCFLFQDFYSSCSYAKQMPFCEKICIAVSPDMKVTIDFQSFSNAEPAKQLDCICKLCASNIWLLLPKFHLKWEFHSLLFHHIFPVKFTISTTPTVANKDNNPSGFFGQFL